MTTLDKDRLTKIRAALETAFAQIAKEHGLSELKAGRISYDRSGSFRVTVEGTASGGLSREAQTYNDLRHIVEGLPELGTSLRLNSRSVTIIGANRTGSKVLVSEPASGKQYLYRAEDIARVAKVQAMRAAQAGVQ